MTTQNLRDELLSVVGVASAEVETDGDAPSGVRVRLLPDADEKIVGAEVQRVLAAHGMRSRIASEAAAVAAPEVPPRPVTPPPVEAAVEETPPPQAEPEPSRAVPSTDHPYAPPGEAAGGGALASLAFEESADGVSVTAIATDGRRFSRRAAAITDEAVAEAVVAAVGALAEGRPQRLLWISSETVDGTTVVTVLVEKADGSRLAGAAVVRAAAAYAVARATWAALRG